MEMISHRSAIDRVHAQVWKALLWALTLLYTFVFLYSSAGLANTRGGFAFFYYAGRLARDHFFHIYEPGFQQAYVLALGGANFFHLPYEAALLIPLTYLPLESAYRVWSLMSLLCILGAVRIMRRYYPQLGWIYSFAYPSTFLLLINGQDTGFLVLLAALSFDAFSKKRDARAGMLLALGLFKFQFFIPLVAILGLKHRRLLAGFAAGAFPLLAACFAMIGKSGVTQYLALMRATDGSEFAGRFTTLRGLAGVLAQSVPNLPVSGIVALSSCAVVLYLARLRTTREALFSLAVLASQLLGYHAHLYDEVLLLIPLAWMAASENRLLRCAPELFLIASLLLIRNLDQNFLIVFLLVFFTVASVLHLQKQNASRQAMIPAIGT